MTSKKHKARTTRPKPVSRNIRENRTETIDQVIEALRDIGAFAAQRWYRGCGSATFNLLPSLYRHPTHKTVEGLLQLEQKMLSSFRQRSIPFRDQLLSEDWDCLFYMQHYHIPTRLLDWSESPFIGLYFALTVASQRNAQKTALNSPQPPDDAILWVLDPITWNWGALRNISYSGDIALPIDAVVKSYAPNETTNLDVMQMHPLCIYGTHNSRRIVAQRGVFVVFGKGISPMESSALTSDFSDGVLSRLIVPSQHIDNMIRELSSIGFPDSVIYPDLIGLSGELKRNYGFGV